MKIYSKYIEGVLVYFIARVDLKINIKKMNNKIKKVNKKKG